MSRKMSKIYGNTFFQEFLNFKALWFKIIFSKFIFQSSPWLLKLDIYKCPFSKTKSRIYFFVETEKNEIKKHIFNQMIHGLSTEILMETIFFTLWSSVPRRRFFSRMLYYAIKFVVSVLCFYF